MQGFSNIIQCMQKFAVDDIIMLSMENFFGFDNPFVLSAWNHTLRTTAFFHLVSSTLYSTSVVYDEC